MFCYNVQQTSRHKPGAMLWQVLPPVKVLGHRNGAKGPQVIFKKDCSKRESNRGLLRLPITNGRKGHQMEKQIVIDNAAIRIEYWQSEGLAHWRLTHPTTGAQKTFKGSDAFIRALIETGTI